MDEYIRKKDAIKSVAKHMRDAAEFDHPYAARKVSEWKPLAKSYLRDAQTIDAEEVVRCKDCLYWNGISCTENALCSVHDNRKQVYAITPRDWFCYKGIKVNKDAESNHNVERTM
jgi:hypothetical protein